MNRATVVVEGSLALRMRRLKAAREGDNGLQILTLPLLAARLAGGFCQPATRQDLDPAIRTALAAGGLAELDSIRTLPGMTRAVGRTLGKAWNADFDLSRYSARNARLADMASLDRRTRRAIPPAVLIPPDLRDRAMAGITHAPAVLGGVVLERLSTIAPVWRPLIRALANVVPVHWLDAGTQNTSWFPGELVAPQSAEPARAEVFSCADPHAEVVESLRWARELIASGHATPEEIGIAAAATETWDDHFLVLAAGAELPLHFAHGMPALATEEGQACAALADLLNNGLSQDRVRRLVGHSLGKCSALKDLPPPWARELPPEAGLFEVEQWRTALDRATAARTDGIDPRPHLLPAIELVRRGPAAAVEAGEALLTSAARELWAEALRRAPAEALEFSLREVRLADGREPGASIAWAPAGQLAAAPRRWVRLLGLTSQGWPRRGGEDPLLPRHLLGDLVLESETVTDQDRRAFTVIARSASGGFVLSRSRRSAQRTVQAPSPLIPRGISTVSLSRDRTPSHAFSAGDRLQVRPQEAAATPLIAAAARCWINRRRPEVTAHDGRIRAGHPLLERALGQTQSATSLRLMLRDPLAFAWRYGLGWRSTTAEEQPLGIDDRSYGELVHELLRRAVDLLEPQPGYLRASRQEIELAMNRAAEAAAVEWPLARAVPPWLLWRHTVDAAAALGLRALTRDEGFRPGTRSWTEVHFGEAADTGPSDPALPWNPASQVRIGDTGLRARGSIDRLDRNASGDVRVSDYKTGREPRQADRIVLGGGTELQRAIYALAARQLLGSEGRIVARLLFLGEEAPRPLPLDDVERTTADLAGHLAAALALLRSGGSLLPGPDAQESWSDFRLALPAMSSGYFVIKRAAFARTFGDFAKVWASP